MIKELYTKGVSISEIARQTGYDRKTIRTIIQGALLGTRPARRVKGRKLDPYRTYLERPSAKQC